MPKVLVRRSCGGVVSLRRFNLKLGQACFGKGPDWWLKYGDSFTLSSFRYDNTL